MLRLRKDFFSANTTVSTTSRCGPGFELRVEFPDLESAKWRAQGTHHDGKKMASSFFRNPQLHWDEKNYLLGGHYPEKSLPTKEDFNTELLNLDEKYGRTGTQIFAAVPSPDANPFVMFHDNAGYSFYGGNPAYEFIDVKTWSSGLLVLTVNWEDLPAFFDTVVRDMFLIFRRFMPFGGDNRIIVVLTRVHKTKLSRYVGVEREYVEEFRKQMATRLTWRFTKNFGGEERTNQEMAASIPVFPTSIYIDAGAEDDGKTTGNGFGDVQKYVDAMVEEKVKKLEAVVQAPSIPKDARERCFDKGSTLLEGAIHQLDLKLQELSSTLATDAASEESSLKKELKNILLSSDSPTRSRHSLKEVFCIPVLPPHRSPLQLRLLGAVVAALSDKSFHERAKVLQILAKVRTTIVNTTGVLLDVTELRHTVQTELEESAARFLSEVVPPLIADVQNEASDAKAQDVFSVIDEVCKAVANRQMFHKLSSDLTSKLRQQVNSLGAACSAPSSFSAPQLRQLVEKTKSMLAARRSKAAAVETGVLTEVAGQTRSLTRWCPLCVDVREEENMRLIYLPHVFCMLYTMYAYE